MYKYLIPFLFFTISVFSQQNSEINRIDSLTYQYYLIGNWDELISTGKKAINNGINFKYLQQRLGYAYFVKQDYYSAIRHYQQSLKFDKTDQVSHTYLYYAAVNINDEEMARYHISKLNADNQAYFKVKKTRIVDALDLEYNFKKVVEYPLRGNANYKRFGVNTQPGFRFNLYQSFSTYNQVSELTNKTIQNEYYLSGTYSLFSRTSVMAAYHYVGTNYFADPDSLKIPGNLWFGEISHNFNRFDISVSQSQFTNDYNNASQTGIQLGILLPIKSKIYLKSALYRIAESDTSRLVFNQTIGALIAKRFWLQGSLTLGNLNNFVDNNALYIYNSMDYTTFRTGGSIFYYLNKNITLFGNYGYDKKLTTDTQYPYKQHSFTGGLIWKL